MEKSLKNGKKKKYVPTLPQYNELLFLKERTVEDESKNEDEDYEDEETEDEDILVMEKTKKVKVNEENEVNLVKPLRDPRLKCSTLTYSKVDPTFYDQERILNAGHEDFFNSLLAHIYEIPWDRVLAYRRKIIAATYKFSPPEPEASGKNEISEDDGK